MQVACRVRFSAYQFRLFLHATAYVILLGIKQKVLATASVLTVMYLFDFRTFY